MKVVLYTTEYEPITVLNMEDWSMDFLRKNGIVRISVMPDISASPYADIQSVPKFSSYIVEIRAERFVTPRGKEVQFLVTGNEESALLLKSAFLPGQTRAVNDVRDNGIAKGFSAALSMLGKI